MAILSPTTLLAWFDLGGVAYTYLFQPANTYNGSSDGNLITNDLGPPKLVLSTNLFTSGVYKDGPIGRYSYGRYLELTNIDFLNTPLTVEQRQYYHRAAWTVALLFRPRSVTGKQVLIGKRYLDASMDDRFSMRMQLNGTTLEGKCQQTNGSSTDLSISSAVSINKVYIAYITKSDASTMAMGIKEVGTGSWLTNGPTGSITVGWSTSFDLYVNAQINAALTGVENVGTVDYVELCWWYSALSPATIQSGIEDHFGVADPASGGGTKSQIIRGISRAMLR